MIGNDSKEAVRELHIPMAHSCLGDAISRLEKFASELENRLENVMVRAESAREPEKVEITKTLRSDMATFVEEYVDRIDIITKQIMNILERVDF